MPTERMTQALLEQTATGIDQGRRAKYDNGTARAPERGGLGLYEASLGGRLSVPDQHQLNVLKKTLRMPSAVAGVMGGPDAKEAERILRKKFGLTDAQIKKLKEETEPLAEDAGHLLAALNKAKPGWHNVAQLDADYRGRMTGYDWDAAAETLKKQGKAELRKQDGTAQIRLAHVC